MGYLDVMPTATTYVAGSLAKKNALKAQLQAAWEEVDYRRETAQRRFLGMQSRALAIETAISTKTSEIATYTTIIASLPDGQIKDDFIEKKTLAEQDLFRLNIRAKNAGGIALVNAKIEVENLAAEFTFLNALHSEVSDLDTPNL